MNMSKVERAIIMAAGNGTRMYPVTRQVPKPLVRVGGVRMIDTILRGLRENGIFEIYVVVGYLKEQFEALARDYPGVRLVENPYYAECNNISSLYVAREYLENAMILDGDQIVRRPEILFREFDRSGYQAVWTDAHTDEWLLTVEEGRIVSCSRSGGAGGWQLFSVSRWNKEDGRRLKGHLEEEFEQRRNRQIYWDDIALFRYPGEYRLGIFEMRPGDVLEVDSLAELAALDSEYEKFLKLGGVYDETKRSDGEGRREAD